MMQEKLRKKARVNGFTLLESMVTLFIVSLLIAVPALEIQGAKHNVEREQAVKTFITGFERAKKVATLSKRNANIKYYAGSNRIVVDQAGTSKLLVQLPSFIRVTGLTDSLRIANDGYVAPTTITFKDGLWARKLSIQMMWGEIVES